nr:HigA family addiction module antitoxin [uncultured Rhodopila sp.]
MSKSSTTTDEIPNPTPGEVLLLDFIEPMGLTQNGLARAIGVPPRRINEIVLGKRAVTADTDLRLARYFGLSDGFWLGLQADHDLMRQRRKIFAELDHITPHTLAA